MPACHGVRRGWRGAHEGSGSIGAPMPAWRGEQLDVGERRGGKRKKKWKRKKRKKLFWTKNKSKVVIK